MAKLSQSKLFETNRIPKPEAEELMSDLLIKSDQEIRRAYKWHVKKGYWPLHAERKNRGAKRPRFIVNHHTGGKYTDPVVYRFIQSRKASAHAIIERSGNILTIAPPTSLCFHAVTRASSPLRALHIRRLLNIELGWLNEYGIETIGNGNKWLFTYDQFVSIICLQRLLCSLYPTIDRIKSHREFSPRSRAGDPGPLYFLPLVEHAIFTDVSLDNFSYWTSFYKDNPLKFANEIKDWFKFYGVEKRDEWSRFRNRKITQKNILEK